MNAEEIKNALPAPTNAPYLIAIVIMAIVTVAAIVIIAVVRPAQDNASINIQIIGFATTTTAAILAFMKAQETHLSVNSRLEQFIKNADRAARSEGELVGRAAGREQADKRTDTLKDKA
jgi:hypothetical protein